MTVITASTFRSDDAAKEAGLALQSVDGLRLLRRNEAVKEIFLHQVRIALLGRSPASARRRGDLDPVARDDRHIGELAWRDLVKGLRNREPLVAALTHHEQLGLRARMAAMNPPGAYLLAVAHIAEGHRRVGAAHGLRQGEAAPAVDQLELLDMPGKAKFEHLDRDVRAVAVDAAHRVIPIGKAAATPTDWSEVVAAEELARFGVGAAK